MYSLHPQKNTIIIFREVKLYELLLEWYKKVLTFMIQNKYH
jgi:hypothetical protein